MRLCIQQKVFSWHDKFNITDENGNMHYYAEGEIFTFGKKIHLYNYMGREVAYIEQELFNFLPRYNIYLNGKQMATIQKEFTFFTHKYSILGMGWTIDGDYFAHDYSITEGGHTIVTVGKQWFTWGDCYLIDIDECANEVMALAAVLVIDCAMEQRN